MSDLEVVLMVVVGVLVVYLLCRCGEGMWNSANEYSNGWVERKKYVSSERRPNVFAPTTEMYNNNADESQITWGDEGPYHIDYALFGDNLLTK